MRFKSILLLAAFLFVGGFTASAQCFQIESILVDACGVDEGLNEMVRFKVGPAAINTSNMDVDWPNNNWTGLIQNATTAAKVATLNQDIQNAGGCGQLLEPTGGALPANATVILVTSHNMDPALNQFGPISEDIYIIFQNNPSNATGHFANYNSTSGIRTLEIYFGSCADIVSYDRSFLVNQSGQNVAADGATVVFTPGGTATYINNGCQAPVNPFSVDAGNSPVTACAGATISLSASAEGAQTIQWSAPSGTFSNAASLTSSYTLAAGATGSITLTLTITNVCGAQISDTVIVNTATATTPAFNIGTTFCANASVPALPTTSTNGITGTWSPSAISNTASGSYVFTPAAGQCAAPYTLNVTITNSIAPTFTIANTFCANASVPALPATSTNGITGTWSPSAISNTASGSYVFTPAAGQCAAPYTLNVTITNSIAPTFTIANTFCTNASVPTLPATSTNGITGTWSPSAISNTASGSYVFTPAAGQCAAPYTLNVTITNSVTPTFSLASTLCSTATVVPILPVTSDNGITGTWSPATITPGVGGTFTFTPAAGQCASIYVLNLTLTNQIVPVFSLPSVLCSDAAVIPTLPTTSDNGITGTWSPATINTEATTEYTFTPAGEQCAANYTFTLSITDGIVPDFLTQITVCPDEAPSLLPTTSPNGITGTWNPAGINGAGEYVFTPDAGQCAQELTLTVIVEEISLVVNQACVGGAKELSVANGFDFADVEWKTASGTVVESGERFDVSEWASEQTTAPVFPMVFEVTVTTDSGCTSSEQITVNSVLCSIPKGVSVNGDTLNDNFDLTGLNVRELKIFNRYGREVYSQSDYTNQWNGQSNNGNELPGATYYYSILTNSGETKTGWVYLVRRS